MPLEDLLKKSDTTDYDESVVKFMPTYPGLSLTSHVVLKNVQVLVEVKRLFFVRCTKKAVGRSSTSSGLSLIHI